MSGQRISGDTVIRQCAVADAEINEVALGRGFKSGRDNYCLPETVFQNGKKGEFFTSELCDGDQPRFLKSRHADGVKVFCQRVNGYPIGATGRKYNGICPKSLENAFLTGFDRGRGAYLNASIANNEDELNDMATQLRRAQSDLESESASSAEGLLSEFRAKQESLKKQNRDMRVELTALGSGDSVL